MRRATKRTGTAAASASASVDDDDANQKTSRRNVVQRWDLQLRTNSSNWKFVVAACFINFLFGSLASFLLLSTRCGRNGSDSSTTFTTTTGSRASLNNLQKRRRQGLQHTYQPTEVVVAFDFDRGDSRNTTRKLHANPLYVAQPALLSDEDQEDAKDPDYGDDLNGGNLRFFLYEDEDNDDGHHRRSIMKEESLAYDFDTLQTWNVALDEDEPEDGEFLGYKAPYYYAYDDDAVRNPYNAYDDDDEDDEDVDKECRRTAWHRNLFPNCNTMHEFDVENRFRGGDTRFLGAGHYREAFIAEPLSDLLHANAADGNYSFSSSCSHDTMIDETVVFKAYRWGSDFIAEDFEFMRLDAMVMELFSSNPKIVGLYGFCGTGMINEAVMGGRLEDLVNPHGDTRHDMRELAIEQGLQVRPDDDAVDDDHHPMPFVVGNELSGTEKLQFALDMAQAVALLHNYPGGVIVHDDISLDQFLLDESSGRLVLNDFNRAEPMLYNEKDSEYCRYRNNPGMAFWRAPEEYEEAPRLNEQIDIWSLGNNMHGILTGYRHFQELDNFHEMIDRFSQGEVSFIDPRFRERSFAEQQLADIIPRCWVFDPEERIDIGTLVEYLQSAVDENERRFLSAASRDGDKEEVLE